MGFEPTVTQDATPVFKTGPLGHSGNSPCRRSAAAGTKASGSCGGVASGFGAGFGAVGGGQEAVAAAGSIQKISHW